MVPINMAFFFKNSLEGRVIALYPSPVGATESLLELESWNEIVARNPVLNQMESDVEGLLVNRLGYSRGYSSPEYYLLLQARGADSHALEGAFRRHGSVAGAGRVLQQPESTIGRGFYREQRRAQRRGISCLISPFRSRVSRWWPMR